MCVEIEDEYVILALIKKMTQSNPADQEYTKKSLHKSLYLLNHHIRVFSFTWGDHGPFSYDIHYVLIDLIHRKYIKETRVQNSVGTSHNLEYVKKDYSYFEIKLKLPPNLVSSLDKIVEFTLHKSPRELELLASVHYLAIDQKFESNEYTVDYIFNQLSILKPYTSFTMSDVQKAIEILEEHKYLAPNKLPSLAPTLSLIL